MHRPALRAWANHPQVIVRINPRVVAVAPVDADRVVAYGFHSQHRQPRFIHRKRIIRLGLPRRCTVRPSTRGAGAFVAEIGEAILAVMRILPIDLDPFRLGNGDVFRVGGNGHAY